MKKTTIGALGSLVALGLILGASQGIGASMDKLRLTESDTKIIPQYGKFEATIETNVQYANPFDPEEADLQVHFLTPTGETHILPAFYDEEDGKPVWKVRYAPLSVGDYRCYATLGGLRSFR